MILSDPSRLWYVSTRWHQRGWKRRARAIKAYNFLLFNAVLPPEAQLEAPVSLGHFGLGVVVHPNVTIGKDVMLWHGVTLSVGDSPGSETRLILGDSIVVGAGAQIIGRERQTLRVGDDVRIGANAVVTSNCVAAGVYVGVPARLQGA